MTVSLRAIFREQARAEAARTEINKNFEVVKMNLLTRDNIEEFANDKRGDSYGSGAGKAAGYGAALGLILGLIFAFSYAGSDSEMGYLLPLVIFVIGGTFAGIVFSTAIFFIGKEKWATVSQEDLSSGDDAILLIRTKKKFMKKIEKYLNTHGAEIVHRG